MVTCPWILLNPVSRLLEMLISLFFVGLWPLCYWYSAISVGHGKDHVMSASVFPPTRCCWTDRLIKQYWCDKGRKQAAFCWFPILPSKKWTIPTITIAKYWWLILLLVSNTPQELPGTMPLITYHQEISRWDRWHTWRSRRLDLLP